MHLGWPIEQIRSAVMQLDKRTWPNLSFVQQQVCVTSYSLHVRWYGETEAGQCQSSMSHSLKLQLTKMEDDGPIWTLLVQMHACHSIANWECCDAEHQEQI